MEELDHYFPNLNAVQREQFSALEHLYEDWNSKINLISRKDMGNFYLHHIIHSLAIAKMISFKAKTKILDVGTGGGFPGIPLAILFPEVKFHLVDSIGKKIKVVKAVAEKVGLKNVSAEHQRAEAVKGKFDFVVSRAVTRAENFLPWVERKVSTISFNEKDNGFLFLKGGDLHEEFAPLGRYFEVQPLSDFFEDSFFETKKVVYLKK